MVTAMTLAATWLAPVSAFSQVKDSCFYWHDAETDGEFEE